MPLYAWLMIFSFAGPFALSFSPRIAFYKNAWLLFTAIILNGFAFVLLGGWFSRTGVWGFNPDHVSDLRWNNLPPEVWLFMVLIPFTGILIYTALKAYIDKQPFATHKHHITLFFLVTTFFLALFNSTQSYTFYNCLFASILLFIHYLFLRKDWIGYFWLTFFVFSIPFLLLNMLLTGTLTDTPVVWYNEHETTGMHILSVPFEDFIFLITCLLFPITIIELFKSYVSKKQNRNVRHSKAHHP